MPTRGIPFPAGDPSLDPEAERAWRRRLLDRALEAVSTAVHAPTIFPMDDQPVHDDPKNDDPESDDPKNDDPKNDDEVEPAHA